MKKTSLVIFSLVIILTSPALLFASGDLLKDITSGFNDLKTNTINWGAGAMNMGVSAGAGAVGFAVGGVKSTAGFAVGTLTGNSVLGNQVATSSWSNTVSSTLFGINQPLSGTSLNGSIGNGLKSNLSATQTQGVFGADFGKNTYPSDVGKGIMKGIANSSPLKKVN